MQELPDLLQRVLKAIAAGRVLPVTAFTGDINRLLRKMEGTSFEKDLLLRRSAVDKVKKKRPKGEFEYINDFMDEVFVHVFTQTESDDLAAYVLEDFALLADAAHVGYEDEWLNGLAAVYAKGKIANDNVKPLPGTLHDHLEKLAA